MLIVFYKGNLPQSTYNYFISSIVYVCDDTKSDVFVSCYEYFSDD